MHFTLVGDDSSAIALVADWLRPYATVYKELFNRHDGEMMEYHDQEGVLLRVGQDPIEFLQNQVFTDHDRPIGFCLPSYQARDAFWSRIWGFVKKNTKIIKIKRNPLYSINGFLDHTDFKKMIIKHEAIQKDLVDYFRDIFLFDFLNWNELLCFLELPNCDQPDFHQEINLENLKELQEFFRDHPYSRYLN